MAHQSQRVELNADELRAIMVAAGEAASNVARELVEAAGGTPDDYLRVLDQLRHHLP
jgi:hypothetical protein